MSPPHAPAEGHPERPARLRLLGAPYPRGSSTPPSAAPLGGDVRKRRSTLVTLLGASRPRQWVKNLLVLAAPGAAGLLGHPPVLLRSLLAAGVFVLASSGTYLLNDVVDASRDREHPEKALRPVASGDLPARIALVGGVVFLAAAITWAALLGGVSLVAVVASYVFITASYTLALKHVPVIELACVASGFVLRAVAGGAAVHIGISPWFVLVTSACALLVVAGKRSTELVRFGAEAAAHRPVLASYPEPFLRVVRGLAAAVAVMSYALWAFTRAANLDIGLNDVDNLALRLSILPFVLGLLYVELAIESGRGGAPEELVLRDHWLQLLGFACLALVAVGIYR